jgi:general secretion pathway protein H
MTLLEALVVVTLTVMIGLIVFPNVERSYAILTFHETTGALVANLRMAHSEAMETGQEVDFTIQNDGHGYSWSGEARRIPLTVDLRMSQGGDIEFYADGSSSGGAIALHDKAHRTDISVDTATGAVTDEP